MPGSPATSAIRPRPAAAASSASLSTDNSASRPTKGGMSKAGTADDAMSLAQPAPLRPARTSSTPAGPTIAQPRAEYGTACLGTRSPGHEPGRRGPSHGEHDPGRRRPATGRAADVLLPRWVLPGMVTVWQPKSFLYKRHDEARRGDRKCQFSALTG